MNLEQTPNLTSLKQPSIRSLTQIQPHGVLLVLQEPDLTILQASRNVSTAFDLSVEQVIGKTLDEILDSFQVDRFRTGLSYENLDLINPTKVWVRRKGDDYLVFDAVFHRSADGFLVLELEPALTHENIPFLSFYHLARASINQLEATSNLQDFCQIIVREVRKVTGFDRVMLYRFDQDLFPDPNLQQRFGETQFADAFARIECHYFVNKGFFEREDQLLMQCDRIRHLPTVIVQGRYDVVCPMVSAWELHRALPEAEFIVVPDAGHSMTEPGIRSALIEATDRFAQL
ncbi:GAF domain-containing protein [Leptolyngbya sp. 7M]|uniref:GAF domain-containing protein n=1 Tax=Leptolyngbya sp. 7M TaxID=2812896 RepID=UPI001B8AE975|nr:alpha/beta hydrolase [Leptolyngbya sp. 7M]QYO67393.1 alpha/beta hydrolase [Leptolyngbya sp. 7M]